MNFRKQLSKRLINRVVYAFTLKAVTDDDMQAIMRSDWRPLDPRLLTIKLVRGAMPGFAKPKFKYYDNNPSFYPGYGGRIMVGGIEVSIIRHYSSSEFNVMETNLIPKRLREEYFRDRVELGDTLRMLGIETLSVE